ncbi:phage tail protein I [Cytobacillus sp. IB215665]|uniref:phage tail protein I n=1 Tax=Cytobacillus sp. IB215665 TaxID=3097357 RepID=UPI002A12C021|nr:phage tail protein I [Cytobacillus sp. IB215665]MDX8367792.1 phage tail protein I [Cytobacillus sp. IB215665]
MNSIQEYSVVDLLPQSLKVDPFMVALGEAFEQEIKGAYREAESMSIFYDVNKLPENLLDYLAFQKHVDFYENSLPIEQKRQLIQNANMWHRTKGTPWAVEQVVSIVFPNAEVFEWFDYSGDPYYFQIEVEQTNIKSDDIKRLIQMVDATKNKRSWLEGIAVKMPKGQLELTHDTKEIHVPYPICNKFSTASMHGKQLSNSAEMNVAPYDFEIKYPVCGKFNAG